MRRKDLKKCLCLGLAAVMTFCTAGCVKSELAGVSQEDKDLYVEYAANLILKHDKNYIDRMRYEELPQEETTTEQPLQEQTTENPDNQSGSQNQERPSGGGVSEVKSMNEILGISGIDIQPNGYEVADAYPSNGSELGMSMVAVKGYKLLIYKFNVTNTSESDVPLNMMESKASYRGIVNDSVRMNVQVTALLDAFNTYNGTIPAGSTKEFVLIFQINANDTENISSAKLNITYNDKQGTVVIN